MDITWFVVSVVLGFDLTIFIGGSAILWWRRGLVGLT